MTEGKMKILFMGTPDFALYSLRAMLDAGENVVAVVTQPDQPRGRGYVLTPPPVKVCAAERGIPVYQPETLRKGAFFESLRQINPDLIVVTAYGKILPSDVLEYPRYGCVNVHASLLPAYRGAAPMQRAILDGQTVTGITTMRMDAGLDTGDIYLQKEVPIAPDDNFEAVHDKMGEAGAKVLLDTIEGLRNGTLKPVPQDASRATYAAKIEKEDCLLDFRRSARELHNQIRGLSPFPLAFTCLPDGKKLKIIAADWTADVADAPAGTVLSTSGGVVAVACGEGILRIRTLLPEGKKSMPAGAFVNGRGIAPGERLGSEA